MVISKHGLGPVGGFCSEKSEGFKGVAAKNTAARRPLRGSYSRGPAALTAHVRDCSLHSTGTGTFQTSGLWWVSAAPAISTTTGGAHNFAVSASYDAHGGGGGSLSLALAALSGALTGSFNETDGFFLQLTGQEVLVPEPSQLPLLAGGLLALAGYVGLRQFRRA